MDHKNKSLIWIIAIIIVALVVAGISYYFLSLRVKNMSIENGQVTSSVAPYTTIVAEVEIVSLNKGELCENDKCNNPTSDSGIIKINKIVSVDKNIGNLSLEKIKENSEMNVTFKYSSGLAKIKYVWPLVSEEEAPLGNLPEENSSLGNSPKEEKVAPLSDGSDVSTLLYPYLDGNYVVYKELVSGQKDEIILPGLEIGSKIRAQILIVNPEANPYLEIGEYQLI